MPKSLPRLGSTEAPKPKTEVIEIPDRGASVVLRKPSVGTIIDLQDKVDDDEKDARKAFDASVALVSCMLVEPEMSEEDLRNEVGDWTFDDWQVLQNAAMRLAGMREEDEREARAEFRSKSD